MALFKKKGSKAASESSNQEDSGEHEKTELEKDNEKSMVKKPAPQGFNNFFRVLSFGSKLDFLLIGLCVGTAVGAGVAMPLMFVVLGKLVGNFTGYFTPGSGVTKAEFQHGLNTQALLIVYIFIGRFFLSYISMYSIRISGLRISAALRSAYIKALFNQSVTIVDTVSPGVISTRITTNSNLIQLGISQQLTMFVQALALTIGLYVVSLIKSWQLTLVASASLPFILIVYGTILPFFFKHHAITQFHFEKASSLAFEIMSSIRIVVAFGAEQRLTSRYDAFIEDARKAEMKNAPLMGLLLSPVLFSTYATFALAFWYGIKLTTQGNIGGIGSITVVLFSVVMAVTSISRLAAPIIAMGKASTAAGELLATIDADAPDQSGLKAPEVSSEEDITFKDVSFVYPSRKEVQVLDKLNLTFETGKVTAIVGPSGSGKSTIVGLLEKWYGLIEEAEPSAEMMKVMRKKWERRPDKKEKAKAAAAAAAKKQTEKDAESRGSSDEGVKVDLPKTVIEGSIFVGKTNISEIDAKWWRAQIGLVQQEPFLFNDTILQNVAYGLCGTPLADLPEEEKLRMVKEACKEAFADEFITKLPLGYDTTVGESGIKLSGGQRQRLAIARSIVKQPSILILDEATSAIDVRTERIVQAALDRVSKNRTTIVIAHRLSTIKKADKIIVMRQGKLVEEGTHDQLLEIEDGVYFGLVRAQAIAMGTDNLTDDTIVLDDEVPEQDEKNIGGKVGGADATVHEIAAKGSQELERGYIVQGFIRSFGRLMYEQRSHWVLYILIVLGSAGGGAVYPIQAFLFANLLNTFTLTGQALVTKGNFWSLMFFIMALGAFVAYYILGWAAHAVQTVVSTKYRKEYMQNIIRKRIIYFDSEGNSAGTLTSRLSSDPTQVEQLMGGQMSMAYVSIFNLTGCFIISFVYGWKLSLVGACTILPVVLVAGYFRVRLEIQFEKMNAAVFEESSQFATEAVGAFRTCTSLIMEDTIINRYDALLKDHVSKAYRKAGPSTLVFSLSDSVDMGCQALIFWYGGTLMGSREYNIVQFFVIYMAIIQGSQAAGTWFSMAPNISQATAGANRILSSRYADANTEHEKQSRMPDEGFVGIEFKDVYFSYKSRDIPVLNGLNLSIKPGQFVALVGATGCGKSTIISLIERFYDTESGSISYGSQDINDLNVAAYRSNISLVAQESTLYEGTIRENVALSVETSDATDEAIQEACKDAQIHEFVSSLPDGYSTALGPKGVSLSGGQRQRLALARALLRKPKILLLDEATSSLDSESEKLVQEAIERAAGEGNRTIIAVAHRLATIQKADIIFVLGSGKVLEQGDHQSLLRAKGVYYSMCQAQALDR